MSSTPKVSVIIPVYNTAEFLRQCLDSIVNQTLQDIEIICVDDGSTDASLDILNEYAANDSRITILTQQNKGGGGARNAGMQIAHGKYLAFLDSDDFFDLTLLEKASSKADATNSDIVLFGAKHYNNQTHEFSPMDYNLNKACLPNKDPFSPLDIPDCIFQLTHASPWSKLFRRDFSERNGLKFQELHTTNDVFYVMSAFSVAERISYVDEALVSYRIGLSSNTQSKKDAYPLDFYVAFLAWRFFLLEHNLYCRFEKSFLNCVAVGLEYNFSTISGKALPKYARENIAAEFGLEMLGSRVVISEQYHQINTEKILSSGKPYVRFKPELPPHAQIVCDTRDVSVQPLISVIIPIYNVEKYLGECLDSVVNQTLHNIEIICVDDGSTDNSLEIAKAYANNDNRFLVLHQANKKQGAARNTGLIYARGTYIQFLDPDDVMVPDAYEILYKKAANEELDVLRFASEPFYDNCNPEKSFWSANDIPLDDIQCTSGEHMFCILTQQGIEYTSCCKAIYRSAYLQSISLTFIEGIIHEDNSFTFKCTLQANRIAFITKKLYIRRIRPGSIMTSPCSYRNLYGYLVSYYDMSRFALTETYKPETQKYIKIMLDAIAWHITSYYNKIPNVDKYCNEYELSILQTFKLKTSPEYRIGRIITFIPRKAKKFVYYLRTQGIKYTLQKTFNWFKAKLTPPQGKLRNNHKIYSYPFQYERALSKWYKRHNNAPLNLENPQTYNEKINWLKLYDATPLKTELADKYLVRNYVREKIGEQYLIPLLGVWEHFDDIDFDSLPTSFVLKANHGCRWNIIVKDKSEFDMEAARKKFNVWMNTNYAFCNGYEMQYLNIPPKIIAEEYIENNNQDIFDYKVFCFDGRAKSILFISNRKNGMKRSFYDLDWNKLPYVYSSPMNMDEIPRPKNLELLIQLAEKLAEGFAHVRVDFYILNDGTIKFGEMTFTPTSGTSKWNPPEIDREYGDLITLPPKSNIPKKIQFPR